MSTLSNMVQQFLGSAHGNDAVQSLQQEHGLSAEDAQHAVAAAAQVAQGAQPEQLASGGMLGGALNGALGGAAAGAAGQILAQRTGMNPQMAQSVVAAAMPFVLRYFQQHGMPGIPGGGQAAPQPAPTGQGSDWFSDRQPQAPAQNTQPMAPPQPEQPAAPKPPWKRFL